MCFSKLRTWFFSLKLSYIFPPGAFCLEVAQAPALRVPHPRLVFVSVHHQVLKRCKKSGSGTADLQLSSAQQTSCLEHNSRALLKTENLFHRNWEFYHQNHHLKHCWHFSGGEKRAESDFQENGPLFKRRWRIFQQDSGKWVSGLGRSSSADCMFSWKEELVQVTKNMFSPQFWADSASCFQMLALTSGSSLNTDSYSVQNVSKSDLHH